MGLGGFALREIPGRGNLYLEKFSGAQCVLREILMKGVGGWMGSCGRLGRLWRTTDGNSTAPPAVYTLLLKPSGAGIMRVGTPPDQAA